MSLLLTAIIPILLLLAAGAVIRRWFINDPAFWRGLEWLSHRVSTPALFITSIADADLGVVPIGPLALSVAAPIMVAAGLLLTLRRPLRADGPALTSIIQGSIQDRSNCPRARAPMSSHSPLMINADGLPGSEV